MAEKVDLEHLDWLVKNRSRNQDSCLKLYGLLESHEAKWLTDDYFFASQALTGPAFSLWRAVFLGEKTGKRAAVFKHSKSFLVSLVEDNAISYPVDKRNNEWTFNYYVESARFRLEYLHERWPTLAPRWVGKKRAPRSRWEYAQSLLDRSIAHFVADLEDASDAGE